MHRGKSGLVAGNEHARDTHPSGNFGQLSKRQVAGSDRCHHFLIALHNLLGPIVMHEGSHAGVERMHHASAQTTLLQCQPRNMTQEAENEGRLNNRAGHQCWIT